MKRREFLTKTGTLAAAVSIGVGRSLSVSAEADRPNILLIITDQQFSDAMSCRIGNRYLRTPAMDRIAENGMLFSRAYSANPICVPSRCSIFTGRYAHETGVQDNGNKTSFDGKYECLGKVFRDGGYDTGYIGKWHFNFRQDNKDFHGFDHTAVLKANRFDEQRPEALREFLEKKRSRPFFLVASYNNPHNICEWARGEELPDGPIGEFPPPEDLPPSRANRHPPKNETDIMSLMRSSYHNTPMFPVGDFDELKWRQYQWAYYRLVEKVDALIGRLLDDLDHLGLIENTLILLTSDHGDCQGAHRFNQKTVFYDESTRVPFVVSLEGATKRGTSDHLVQTGIDILPTLCDFAELETPQGLPGLSVRSIAELNEIVAWRDYVVASNHMAQGGPVGGTIPRPHGRMLRSERYKYCLYSQGELRESLVDMEKDPGEMINLVGEESYEAVLIQHRKMLKEHAEQHNDDVALSMLDQL